LAASCPEGKAAEGVLPATSMEAVDFSSAALSSSSSSQSANAHSFIHLTQFSHSSTQPLIKHPGTSNIMTSSQE